MLRRFALIVLLAVCAGEASPALAQQGGTALTPKQRERERKAMSAFASNRYQEALDLYADLYADFHDPIYLRNIGRCHYKLKQPDQAISSFEDYLSKYKRLSGREIDEVRGWIADMKELQKQQQTPAPAPVETPAPVATPAPVVVAPPVIHAPAPAIVARPSPPPAEDEGNRTIRRVGVGALIVGAALAATGGVLMATSWSKFNESKSGACLATGGGCAKAADSIEQRNTLSQIFLAAGGAAGLAGGAMIVFFPVSEPTRGAGVSGFGASAGWVF
jgi:tetratricopeptide (TPR) repeat protein